MDTTVTFANGVIYRTHDALSSSYGSTGVANIHVLLSEFDGGVDAWTQLQLHDEVRGVRTGRRDTPWVDNDAWVPEHRLPTEDCLLVTDALGSESIYLRCGSSHEGAIDALDDYPAIDDTAVCAVEEAWEYEAWDEWIRDALFRAMRDTDLRDWAEMFLDDETLFKSYRTALDTADVYPEIERRAVVLDVKHIVTAFEQALRAERERAIEPRDCKTIDKFDETGGC